MKKCNSNLLFLAIGAAVGTAVGYVVASDKKEEWMDDINHLVDRIKCNVKSSISKGKAELDELIEDEED